LSIDSGHTPFTAVEDSEPSQIVNTLIEQIRYEKGGTAGAYSPIRIFVDGDTKKAFNKILIEECLVEESVDRQREFPYQEFLCFLHKRIRSKIQGN